ncbi:MAG: methionyl-tRNA formyltransferase [Candidatus Taylorbacteria bacterium]|nr:methionyl-tRNA formyltransferase [Candidatus Taylorbacteria bacterium]
MNTGVKWAFFGSSEFSIIVLNELKKAGFLPSLIITTVDKPKGRKLILTPTPVKVWTTEEKIPVLTPIKLSTEFPAELQNICEKEKIELFIVASYGKIIPESVLSIPKYKCLNVHPSLLPKYRGPSPLQSMILNDEKNIGVTIMLMDKEMDHGGIVVQKNFAPSVWPMPIDEFEKALGALGGTALAEIIPKWTTGEIKEKEQNHAEATFTKKITKEDGLIDLHADAYKNYLKICAFKGWPTAYFFKETNETDGTEGIVKTRVIIKDAEFENGELNIKTVLPEGKKEMPYKSL